MMARRILVAIPHPDDEVVGCAAAIRRAVSGSAVFGVYLTTGVPPLAALWPWQRRSYATRVAQRRREAIRAASVLGLEAGGFSDRPSRTLAAHLPEALAELREAIARVRAEALWVPAWEGAHQDHDAANFLAAQCTDCVRVLEFAEYNYAGGTIRSQRFPTIHGGEILLHLTAEEIAAKRALLALYRSERHNLAHIGATIESFRPLPQHDYAAPPHPGRLFCERFHWVPLRHPRIDPEPAERVRAMLTRFADAK